MPLYRTGRPPIWESRGLRWEWPAACHIFCQPGRRSYFGTAPPRPSGSCDGQNGWHQQCGHPAPAAHCPTLWNDRQKIDRKFVHRFNMLIAILLHQLQFILYYKARILHPDTEQDSVSQTWQDSGSRTWPGFWITGLTRILDLWITDLTDRVSSTSSHPRGSMLKIRWDSLRSRRLDISSGSGLQGLSGVFTGISFI